MYYVSAQGVDERMINVQDYYYYHSSLADLRGEAVHVGVLVVAQHRGVEGLRQVGADLVLHTRQGPALHQRHAVLLPQHSVLCHSLHARIVTATPRLRPDLALGHVCPGLDHCLKNRDKDI